MPEARALDAVAQAAVRVFGVPARGAAITPLPGTVDRRCFVLSIRDERVIGKLAENRGGATITVQEEHDLMEAAHRDGLCARPLGHDAESGVLFVEYFHSARAWTRDDVRQPENIDRIAGRLRALHALPLRVRRYDARHFARAYGASAGETAELDAAMQLLDDSAEAAVLCHGDLVASNVLELAGRIVLIDFEYAALAPPIVDLASLAAMNDYDATCRRRLLAGYGSGCDIATFDKVVQMQRLIARLWAQGRETD